jgi:hypothetical protein
MSYTAVGGVTLLLPYCALRRPIGEAAADGRQPEGDCVTAGRRTQVSGWAADVVRTVHGALTIMLRSSCCRPTRVSKTHSLP